MTKEEILHKQEMIIRKVLQRDDITLTSETSADQVDGWDSFTHIQIISEIENDFQISFTLSELQDLQNVGEMTELIFSKLNE